MEIKAEERSAIINVQLNHQGTHFFVLAIFPFLLSCTLYHSWLLLAFEDVEL